MLRRALDDALCTVRSVAEFDFPDVEFDHELLSLTQPGRYPDRERHDRAQRRTARSTSPNSATTSSKLQVPHSTALHATLDGGRYLTGPLARYSLNSAALSPIARQAAAESGLGRNAETRSAASRFAPSRWSTRSRRHCESSASTSDHRGHSSTCRPRAGIGHGVSEAPRGLLYHRYEIDDDGLIQSADIVPPTAQNQAAIEHEMAGLVAANVTLDDATLTSLCEKSIRNHDPCISCSAHFLTLTVDRR